MKPPSDCPIAGQLARLIRGARESLVREWVEHISERVDLEPHQMTPGQDLINHVPLLIDGIADYVENPANEISKDTPVVVKALELGELRYNQQFGAQEILREYEILGEVVFAFLVRTADGIEEVCTRGELLLCSQRVFRAVSVIQQFTTNHFLSLAWKSARDREDRLRGFNRTVSHELKNHIHAAQGASALLRDEAQVADAAQRHDLAAIVHKHVVAMQETLDDLIELSRDGSEGASTGRNVLLAEAVTEAVKPLEEFARERGVTIEVSSPLPQVAVPGAVVEVALTNLITNAIKYRDSRKPDSWVRIEAEVNERGGCDIIVSVRDNGIGVPETARDRIFEPRFRAHESILSEEGSGLGLSIVRESLHPLGGRIWAEFPGEGSVFSFSVPCGS